MHVMGRGDIYPVRTSKVGCLLHQCSRQLLANSQNESCHFREYRSKILYPSERNKIFPWQPSSNPSSSSSSSSYMALQLLYRVLAFSTNSFHLLLSWARVFQFGTFIFCISFLTSSPPACVWSSCWPSWYGFPGVNCLYHSRTLHPFIVTEPAQSLCSDEVYCVLTFYYFIQLLVRFYSPYEVFIVWAEDFPFKYQ